MSTGRTERIAFASCAEVGLHMVDALVEHGLRPACFVTLAPEQAERQRVSGYVDLRPKAEALGVPAWCPTRYSLKHADDLAFFSERRFDLLVVMGWQRLIPDAILDTLRAGGLGVHGSADLLPMGRGRSPINWSLIEGRKRFVFHLFRLAPGADDGEIVARETVDINAWDDVRTLYYKNSIVTARMLVEHIPRLLRGEAELQPQIGEPTWYRKRTPEDGVLDWSQPVFSLYDQVRALTRPYPGAFTWLRGEKCMIWRAQPFDTRILYPRAALGEVVEVFPTGDFVVNARGGLLLVTECDRAVARGDRFTSGPA